MQQSIFSFQLGYLYEYWDTAHNKASELAGLHFVSTKPLTLSARTRLERT